jgi:general secretion pathway protein A
LQIVLVGQPELDVKLDSFALRPLKQRIALRAHLTPLDEQDTDRYIVERLTIAGEGAQTDALFSPEAVKAIHKYSRGFPRLINTICENCLITGYAKQIRTIPAEIVLGVAADFHLSTNGSKIAANGKSGEAEDLERMNSGLLRDLSASHGRNGSGAESNLAIEVEAEEHEPNI